jgi:hypothetical protein
MVSDLRGVAAERLEEEVTGSSVSIQGMATLAHALKRALFEGVIVRGSRGEADFARCDGLSPRRTAPEARWRRASDRASQLLTGKYQRLRSL